MAGHDPRHRRHVGQTGFEMVPDLGDPAGKALARDEMMGVGLLGRVLDARANP